MAFIKITKPRQREDLARELQDVRNSIKASKLQFRHDKQGWNRDFNKFFKLVVEAQEKTVSKIAKTIGDLQIIQLTSTSTP